MGLVNYSTSLVSRWPDVARSVLSPGVGALRDPKGVGLRNLRDVSSLFKSVCISVLCSCC
jgi:hypothetical protein